MGTFGEWDEWTACPVTCGTHPCNPGTNSRERTIKVHDQHGGKPCPDLDDSRPCPPGDQPECIPPPCPWADWGPWSPCSVSCGDKPGSRQRSREPIKTDEK